jgi:methyltransferase (TIGR00027 family)
MTRRPLIVDVTDTAFWVAACRAKESKRSRAAFRDPLAAVLAGEHGAQIAKSMPRSAAMDWAVVIRTSAIDRLIADVAQRDVDTVINLGAGLDTRPYRMPLPPHLRWIEIDFQNLLDLKNRALNQAKPACRLERLAVDLANTSHRAEVFARLGSRANKVLLIAEGLIPYFSNDDVASLAKDLLAIPSFQYWILDFDNAGVRPPIGWEKRLAAAPMLFQPKDWFGFFATCGWRAVKVITSCDESERLKRPYPLNNPLGFIMHSLPRKTRRQILSLSGAALMTRHVEIAPS